MEKEQNQKVKDENSNNEEIASENSEKVEEQNPKSNDDEKQKELTPEEKILELEDKLARTFAEMENQRRRFEKEREDAFDYGGFALAKELLSLIDNLDRSKQSLENDPVLKETDALKKMID